LGFSNGYAHRAANALALRHAILGINESGIAGLPFDRTIRASAVATS